MTEPRDEEEGELPDPLELPIDGVLDLHTFRPGEAGDLIPDYLEECRKQGIFEVRIIHGKGTGRLRETVRRILERQPTVVSIRTPTDASGWGATLVKLKREST